MSTQIQSKFLKFNIFTNKPNHGCYNYGALVVFLVSSSLFRCNSCRPRSSLLAGDSRSTPLVGVATATLSHRGRPQSSDPEPMAQIASDRGSTRGILVNQSCIVSFCKKVHQFLRITTMPFRSSKIFRYRPFPYGLNPRLSSFYT
jgi:hypothetical protein